jgi:cellulase/cellobiase CelA1
VDRRGRSLPSPSTRTVVLAGVVLAVLFAGVVAQSFKIDPGGGSPAVGSSGGCLFAPATCPEPTGTATSPPSPRPASPPPATATTAPATGVPAPTMARVGGAGQPPPTRPASSHPPRAAGGRPYPPGTAAAHPPAGYQAGTVAAAPVVEYGFSSRWDTGYVVLVKLTNTSRGPWKGWHLRFRLGGGSRVVNSWNTRLTVEGSQLRAADDGWNAVVVPGGRVEFGMENTGSFHPAGCVLNGVPCRFRAA